MKDAYYHGVHLSETSQLPALPDLGEALAERVQTGAILSLRSRSLIGYAIHHC